MKKQMLLIAGCFLLSSCVAEQQEPEEVTTADTVQQMDTSRTGGMQEGAEQQFLRNMANHHAGMIVIAADAMSRATDDSVRTAARAMHDKQQAQQDTLVMMMQQMHGVQHSPTVMPRNTAQADSLRQMTGGAVDEYFLRTTIYHHQEGVEMVDMYLPRMTNPEVRQMAERMKSEQEREIQELQGKLGSL